MMGAPYPTKKALKASIGEPLRHQETSLFGPEYPGDGTGVVTVVGPDAYTSRKWYATVTLRDHKIVKVT